MSHVLIFNGLRRLEFSSPSEQKAEELSEEVLVEFVRVAPLEGDETVRVPLGRRGACNRELSGRPTLIRTDVLDNGSTQYHYRIHGPIESHKVLATG